MVKLQFLRHVPHLRIISSTNRNSIHRRTSCLTITSLTDGSGGGGAGSQLCLRRYNSISAPAAPAAATVVSATATNTADTGFVVDSSHSSHSSHSVADSAAYSELQSTFEQHVSEDSTRTWFSSMFGKQDFVHLSGSTTGDAILAENTIESEIANDIRHNILLEQQPGGIYDVSNTINYLTPDDFFAAKFLPIRTAQFLMDWTSDHLPFWIIVLSIPWITKMCITIPIIIKTNIKMEEIMHLLPKAMREFGENNEVRKTDPQQWSDNNALLYKKYGFNPYIQNFRQFTAALIQVPIHLTFFIATRTMYPSYPNWKLSGGAAWFTDLSVPDPVYVWPVMCSAALLLSVWSFTAKKDAIESVAKFTIPTQAIVVAGGIFAILFVPISSQFSVGFNIYLASNMVSFVMQGLFLDSTQCREMVGLRPKSYGIYHQQEIGRVTKELKQTMGKKKKLEFVPIESGKHNRNRRSTPKKSYK